MSHDPKKADPQEVFDRLMEVLETEFGIRERGDLGASMSVKAEKDGALVEVTIGFGVGTYQCDSCDRVVPEGETGAVVAFGVEGRFCRRCREA